MASKVCLIGLDCAPPELVFGEWRDQLPNLKRLMDTGVYGPLESTIPPITVPAWMCMMTGQDPGVLGVYGFRNRKDHSYDGLSFANSRMVKHETIWDALEADGKRSILLGIPLTYPPRPINGLMVCDFLAPDTNAEYTYPAELKEKIRRTVGDYIIDVREFRTTDRDHLLKQIYAMTERRFKLASHLLLNEPWDLFAMVEMGPDRMHHAFWRYFDKEHPLYVPGSQYENAIRDYYIRLDKYIGDLVAVLPPDTLILVVSDHGAKRMDGAICFNEWLIQEGYLVLKQPVTGPTRFTSAMVDWSRTKAWGDGGYYGRLFVNALGREPEGIVKPEDTEALLAEISAKLEAMGDEHGSAIGTRVYRPEEVYKECANIPPDLIVYFGDLNWRSIGSIGHGSVWVHENDTGPDDANHAQYGIAILSSTSAVRSSNSHREANPGGEAREGMSIYDIAPTILRALNIEPPAGMGGSRVPLAGDSVYSEEEEAKIAQRLEDLGYL